MTLHFLMTSLMTLNQHKIENYVIIASLKSEPVGKLINRISGSSLPCSILLLYKRNHGMCLYQVMMTLHFLNDFAYDAESTQN